LRYNHILSGLPDFDLQKDPAKGILGGRRLNYEKKYLI
jgi:hypothetical protein